MIREPTRLTVMVFPGTQTLPLFAAQARGFLEKRGLIVELKPAPNSEEQRAGLVAGRYQIVHGAADQCVALVEAAKVDAMIVALLAADKFGVSERKVAIAAVINAIFRRLRILGQHLTGRTHTCAYLPRA